ncbi:MAG: transglutaminase family protein [Lacunisphaera sp.]
MQAFLQSSRYIDFDSDVVANKAAELADGAQTESDVAERCFTFVRDQIQHSWDFQRNPVTIKASDVLRYGTGYCYAKSHLLAALLRFNGIPAGLCYQRLSFGDSGAPYCLHGLNAVYLKEHGWYRIDARGNKPGVAAMFCPPREVLAFSIRERAERDLPEIWSEPLAVVISAMEKYPDVALLAQHLPDIELLG